MNDDFFSEWCALCVAGDRRDHPSGSHQRHVREQRQRLREHLAKRFTWRWEVADTVKPLPRGSGQGPELLAASYVDQQQEPSESISGQAAHTQDDQLS